MKSLSIAITAILSLASVQAFAQALDTTLPPIDSTVITETKQEVTTTEVSEEAPHMDANGNPMKCDDEGHGHGKAKSTFKRVTETHTESSQVAPHAH